MGDKGLADRFNRWPPYILQFLGAMGRMGQMIASVAEASDDLILVGGLEYAESPHQGQSFGEGVITSHSRFKPCRCDY